MTNDEIAKLRLYSQYIACSKATSPGELLAHLGAMQAQDYNGALWSIGLRLPGFTRTDVEQAILDRTIVRTWPMRGTLHFVPAADIHWMLKLLTPKVISGSAGRHRQLELDEAVFLQARKLITSALEGNKILSRSELFGVLEQGGISPAGQRGYHILGYLAQQQVICFGPHNEKQPTFVLLDEWIPTSKELSRDEALQTLTERYFTSHGPATLQDYVNWTGLTLTDARNGLKLACAALQKLTVDNKEYWMSIHTPEIEEQPPQAYLLSGFDEFMLGYKDRSAALSLEYTNKICPGNNGVFYPTLVFAGQVCGTWKSAIKARGCTINPQPFYALSAEQQGAFQVPAHAYEHFIGLPVTISWPDT
jgi:hypothetical protein